MAHIGRRALSNKADKQIRWGDLGFKKAERQRLMNEFEQQVASCAAS
jgi:hypothetical protein